MIYHQPDWKIFTCQYVMSRWQEDSPESKETFIAVILYTADTLDEAYEAAREGIPAQDCSFHDEDGVTIFFRCLGIHDIQLEQSTWEDFKENSSDDGTHLCSVDLPQGTRPEEMVRSREELDIFRER